MNKKERNAFLLIIILGTSAIIPIVLLAQQSGHFQKDYWNELPPWWTRISYGFIGDNLFETWQGFVAGDLWGNGTPAYLGALSHGFGGIYLQANDSGLWRRVPLTSDYDDQTRDDYYCQKAMSGYDFDGDGFKEAVTGFDIVRYFNPPTDPRRYAGLMYIDLSNVGNKIVTQPLIWGKWGGELFNETYACSIPVPAPGRFKNETNLLPGVLVPANTDLNGTAPNCFRILFVEQPDCGFAAINYTYTQQGVQGTWPYSQEPSYMKHLFVDNGGPLSELVWSPSGWIGASIVQGTVSAVDLNGDQWLDLVVSLIYYNPTNIIGGRVEAYLREPNNIIRPYVFTQNGSIAIDNACFGYASAPANLDGNASTGYDGKEACVVAICRPTDAVYSGDLPSGIATVTWNGTSICLHPLKGTEPSHWPYYAAGPQCIAAEDVDGDGYDDALAFLSYFNRDSESVGDVMVFLNPNRFGGGSILPYNYSASNARKILSNQTLSYTFQICDANMDGWKDLVVSTVIGTPHWTPNKIPIKAAYYCSLHQNWSEFGLV